MFASPTKDLLIILVIVLLIFGPKRLPGLGKQLGTGMREFKDSITGDSPDSETDAEPSRAELPRAEAAETRPVAAETRPESSEASTRQSEAAPERRA